MLDTCLQEEQGGGRMLSWQTYLISRARAFSIVMILLKEFHSGLLFCDMIPGAVPSNGDRYRLQIAWNVVDIFGWRVGTRRLLSPFQFWGTKPRWPGISFIADVWFVLSDIFLFCMLWGCFVLRSSLAEITGVMAGGAVENGDVLCRLLMVWWWVS